MSSVCSQCGGTDIEYDQARGDAVCTSCGSVLEDNIIVSEITFQEQSSGASTVVGQFVSSEGGKNPLSGTGFHHGMGKDSREVTLQQAKKRLTNLGNLLKLNHHCIDSAFMFFKMALNRNLTRGRKSSIVDTACLYLVCRNLLLDFSDVLQINVYALGRAYLKLATALHINPPAIDPCLYIHRFAHKLELAEKTHEVSVTAMRLVARMKRDWIHHGRRPAGLCGAALLVAARLHNFNRSVREVAKVVKLSEGTIRKRLGDFKDTASSRLTIDEFLKIDLEQEHDPPSFNDAKKKSKQQQQQHQTGEVGEEGDVVRSKERGEEGEEEEEEGGRGGGGGFGGIVIGSVEETIERARIAEAFMNASSTAGLSENLDTLATLVDQEDNGVARPCERPEDSELNLEGIDDKEIEMMLLSEEEAKIKAQLWYSENADFLKEQEVKREKLAALEAAKADKPKKKYNKRKTRVSQPASTAGEAIERMLVERRISTKINYDVLKDLDKTMSSQGESSHQPTLVEEPGASRHSVAGVTSETSQGGLGEGGDEGVAGFSGCGSPPVTPRSPLVPGRRDRLPSLQSRKRSLPSFARGYLDCRLTQWNLLYQYRHQ
ncbi:Transcription factor IIIB 90 kDa subunit [Geodia barretti]|uniref:B-related factor 1 n=1 Tax=Geodia barretti TaxID=519541 RepID=A0AA35WLC6_GEOBA|nr:Transcription factor IIIB 90 kDa subunit [Geodia barretti]